MFTIQLATGDTFNATVVDESFRKEFGWSGNFQRTLNVECTPSTLTLDEYINMVKKPNALSTITASTEDGVVSTYQGYKMVNSLSQRMLDTGEKQLLIVFAQTAE